MKILILIISLLMSCSLFAQDKKERCAKGFATKDQALTALKNVMSESGNPLKVEVYTDQCRDVPKKRGAYATMIHQQICNSTPFKQYRYRKANRDDTESSISNRRSQGEDVKLDGQFVRYLKEFTEVELAVMQLTSGACFRTDAAFIVLFNGMSIDPPQSDLLSSAEGPILEVVTPVTF